jgi:hypothetical protein
MGRIHGNDVFEVSVLGKITVFFFPFSQSCYIMVKIGAAVRKAA